MVLLTTDAPPARSVGDRAWRALRSPGRDGLGAVYDVVELEAPDAQQRLSRYASEGPFPLGGDRAPSDA